MAGPKVLVNRVIGKVVFSTMHMRSHRRRKRPYARYHGDVAHLCEKCGYWHLSRFEWLYGRLPETPVLDSCDKFLSEENMEIISALKNEASKLQHQLDGLNSAIKALGGGNNSGRGNGRRRKRHVSAASKAKMAASQKARWAKIKVAKKNA